MLIIPYQDMQIDTLYAFIEEFVTREGTDYGDKVLSITEKVEQVLSQLNSGDVCLCYDESSESCNILPAVEAKSLVG